MECPNIAPLQDPETLEWDRATTDLCCPRAVVSPTIDLSQDNHVQNMSSGAISAMTKLSDSMIRHQEAALRNQEEKSDTRMKAWRRLPKIQQNIILLGGMEEDGTVPTDPTEEMYSVLGCQNGAQVEQYLRQSLQGHNIALETGFCTALNKGILACPNDNKTPKNFTPFLTPPVKDGDEEESGANLLKLACQEKYESSDLHLLTKMDATIPMKTQDLRHHLKNYAACAGRCFGQMSLIFLNLQELADHVDNHEVEYNYEYLQEKLFGGSLMDKLHYRVHKFLESYASGDETKVDSKRLDFRDMMNGVESREYSTKIPAWIKRLTKQREAKRKIQDADKDEEEGHGRPRNNGRKRRQFQPRDQRNNDLRIRNENHCKACGLKESEQFRDLFHPGNIRSLTKPTKNGEQLCLRYHVLGHCFQDCKFKSGHQKLSQEDEAKLSEFLSSARQALAQFQQRRKGTRGGESNSNQDNKPPTPGE